MVESPLNTSWMVEVVVRLDLGLVGSGGTYFIKLEVMPSCSERCRIVLKWLKNF